MAKRRRHASSRASWLARNSSYGIGRLRVHNPPGERKSGMPDSVEIPAPVKGTMTLASAIMSPSRSTPLRRSDAIILGICPDRKACDRCDRSLQGGPDICKRRQTLPSAPAFGRSTWPLLLGLGALLSPWLRNQKIFPLLAGLDFASQPSGGAAPAAPGLAGLWMPVFRRNLCAFYRAGLSPPIAAAVAANLRELRLQFGPFRLQKLIDIPAHREQLGYRKVFYIGRWH